MLQINDLSFKYEDGPIVLNNINLKINPNEKVTIIGKSGCGKTTLLFLLASILKPTCGEIIINNEKLNKIRQNTGVIFQNNGLFPWKTVYENLAIGLKARNLNNNLIEEKINCVLDELGISDIKNKYIKNISGGQKQRVAIGRVLVLNSDLLLLDEPSSALDALTKDSFQNTLLNMYKTHNLTTIMVTHDIFEAVFLGQKIILMKNGQIDEIINNDLYGDINVKNSTKFYQKCIEIKNKLE